jgi:hypothetical protein
VLSSFTLANVTPAQAELGEILVELRRISPRVAGDDESAIGIIEALLEGLQRACEWYNAVLAGDATAVRFRDSSRGWAELARSKSSNVPFQTFSTKATVATTKLAEITEITEIPEFAQLLAEIPVPPFVVEAKDPFEEITGKMQVPSGAGSINVEADDGPVVVGVMFSVDGKPWINPNVLQVNLSYDIGLTLKVSNWPAKADRVVLDFVSTLPSSHYRMSEFVVPRPASGNDREFICVGQVVFPVTSSLFSEPALLQTRAAFLSSADPSYVKMATIIGYHKLMVRVVDPTQVPYLTKYRTLDSRLIEIVDQVRGLPGVLNQHLADFIEAFTSILNYAGVCAQTAIYSAKNDIHEDDFQRGLLVHLRSQLGEDVLEAPRQSGGITDIKYKSVVIELKVEKSQSDREKLFASFESQPVQYASATGAQLSLLCVLDLCSKVNPPAPPQNGVKLLEPLVHGYEKGKCPYPVRVGAVVIDGNLQLPSSYSK